jgi:hypothetical protein
MENGFMANKNIKTTKTATEVLKILWEEGVFRNWVRISIVVEELARKGYHFPLTNVSKAMKRAKYLIRRGKRSNYEYIQKYPYIEETRRIKSEK